MAPKPTKQNPQYQSVTTWLKNICRDYPAGGGILRELLQNADDAGAQELLFVLDTRSHPTENLLDPGLARFQGPALFAYNDGIFTDEDFASLASLGDSRKLSDKHATGKFGRGFSSVYNWTDGPTILSRSTLQFLDPHHFWTKAFDPPGGPSYDFPSDADDEAMINQLASFSYFDFDHSAPLDGTIIRIPLRDANQAPKSLIRNQETTISDVRTSMESFGKEMDANGLLFLKSVRKVSLKVDNELLASTEVINVPEVASARADIKEALTTMVQENGYINRDIVYKMQLKHTTPLEMHERLFAVQHHFGFTNTKEPLNRWAADNKCYPWVALAAPLDELSEVDPAGQLYSVLPLSIQTKQPVQIHGLFSISTDRARLHGPNDRTAHDRQPHQWNKYLFDNLVPRSWADLLGFIARSQSEQDWFKLWPREPSVKQEMWDNLCQSVIKIVSQERHAVWYTDSGYVALSNGLFASGKESPAQVAAFRESQVPVIYGNDLLRTYAAQTPKYRQLSPETLTGYLRTNGNLKAVSGGSKLILLDYLLSALHSREFASLELFPFEDGVFRPVNNTAVFLHRDNLEKSLFVKTPQHNLDIDKISQPSLKKLRDSLKESNTSSLRFRQQHDITSYFLQGVFHGADAKKDVIQGDQKTEESIGKLWEWIAVRAKDASTKNVLVWFGALWVIPTTNGELRKLVPSSSSQFVSYGSNQERMSTMLSLSNIKTDGTFSAPPILNAKLLGGEGSGLLFHMNREAPKFRLRNVDQFKNFLEWLAEGRHVVERASTDEKETIICQVQGWYWSSSTPDLDLVSLLKQLYIYREISETRNESGRMVRQSWTDLTGTRKFYGVRQDSILLPMKNIAYLDLRKNGDWILIKHLGLAKCSTLTEMLDDLWIPSLSGGGNRERLAELGPLLFNQFAHLSPKSKNSMRNLEVVPLDMGQTEERQKYASAVDLVNPARPELKAIFFDHEHIYPDPEFHRSYSALLIECGMKTELDSALALDRVRKYADHLSIEEVAKRAQTLLELPLHCSLPDDYLKQFRTLPWLPAMKLDQTLGLVEASKCRDERDVLLVGKVLPTLPFKVHVTWHRILGWHNVVDVQLLMSQLAHGAAIGDYMIVDAVLEHVRDRDLDNKYILGLKKTPFVWTSRRSFTTPEKAFHRDCENLQPYFFAVDSGFGISHKAFLKRLGVRDAPSLEDLTEMQGVLEKSLPSDPEALRVALKISELASKYSSSSLNSFKVPDERGILMKVEDLVFNDVVYEETEAKVHVSHPGISRDVADRLRIEPLSARLSRGELGISDLDEEDFDQKEEVADGIRDTLGRYPIRTTFHEYLANADDCGASEVNWLLDEKQYSTKRLLTPDLAVLQGPSLLVHNDQVFSENDYEGLKRVGRGSKRDDSSTIGKFGRGSQTMYHFTDLPMVLSGEYMIILDPQQRCLPFNYRTQRRKAGIKVKLSKLRKRYPDQLVPFEGLWGYSDSLDSYNGTIFRFAFRKNGEQSDLLETDISHGHSKVGDMFTDLFDEARLSLLFLRNIRSVDFSIKGRSHPGWTVHWPPESGGYGHSDWSLISVTRSYPDGSTCSATERWWRAIEDKPKVPENVEAQYHNKRAKKSVEVGIAVHVEIKYRKKCNGRLENPIPRFFNCLPLRFESKLPVHIHATFMLSGDRQDIATDTQTQNNGSEWNIWLLQEEIPRLYLSFLDDLGKKIGQDIFNYFPPKSTAAGLSDIVSNGFWEMISDSRHRLYPVAVSPSNPAKAAAKVSRVKERRAKELVELVDALFDHLNEKLYSSLKPSLPQWLDSIVQTPAELRGRIAKLRGARIVTSKTICEQLRSRDVVQRLKPLVLQDRKLFTELLEFITPKKNECSGLDGCMILPLADDSLGTLHLIADKETLEGFPMYYSCDTDVRELFSFASNLLSKDEVHKPFVEALINSNAMNLHQLQPTDIQSLLQCRSWPSYPHDEERRWLVRFWGYINDHEKSTPAAPEAEEAGFWRSASPSISEFPLHKACSDKMTKFISAEDMTEMPVVVRPDQEEHRKLCRIFPGLYQMDPATLPSILATSEMNLLEPASANRFFIALLSLASQDRESITKYTRKYLREEHVNVMQKVCLEISVKTIASKPEMAEGIAIVNGLPVWPSVLRTAGYLTATEAFSADNSAFLLPWIPDYKRFIDPEFFSREGMIRRELGYTRKTEEAMLSNYILPNLPTRIDSKIKEQYCKLVSAISASKRMTAKKKNERNPLAESLRIYALAARNDGILVRAQELYNRHEDYFQRAFRAQADTRFLMQEVESLSLWSEIGLRSWSRSEIDGNCLVASLTAVSERFLSQGEPDPNLFADAKVVVSPLCGSEYGLMGILSSQWMLVRSIPVFQSKTEVGSQPRYRQLAMRNIAQSKKVLAVEQITAGQHLQVCWSQASFALYEPSSFCFAKCSVKDAPSTAQVWLHLLHLSKIAAGIQNDEINQFLEDLRSTYNFLQERLLEARDTFNLKSREIWFNVDDISEASSTDMATRWKKVEHLMLLSPHDSPPLMRVGSFLLTFERLLKSVGCRSVIYPPNSRTDRTANVSTLDSLRTFRHNHFLTDATFSVAGKSFAAHKLVLAAQSPYCRAQFNGKWDASSPIELRDISPPTLSILLDFAYDENFNWTPIQVKANEMDKPDVVADKLDVLLDIIVSADRWLMQTLLEEAQQQVLDASRIYIQAGNVRQVMKIAAAANARALERYCREFERQNRDFVTESCAA